MVKLHSLEDFKEMLGDSVDELNEYSLDVEKLYEKYREPGKDFVELDWHDFQDLLKYVRESAYERGRESGFQDGLLQGSM